ncbi:hypothetical protein D6D21_05859 [Aureobasidium pullulans]|uniref:RING-type domain-containing protein n=1 Tax=Aureobasidium pullulans TaxID=5580 RepID=A0AB74IVF3_AURPU|nr:hypothetical protein D6D21_05859 [Aureobasidium pullulans]
MPTLKRDRSAMSDEGSRKRAKTSPFDDTPAVQPPMDMDTVTEEPLVKPAVDAPPSQELQTLQILRGDFDDLRQLITCKVCERLLYEPYVISCGHTYCYSCLCTWFATSKKKTCPNCRDIITQPPAPSYVIKEMANIFMRRHDLLPDGETIEQHEQWKFEEADLVRKDKNNTDPRTGGLFRGVFKPRRPRVHPIHDPIDHIDRCPECNWEVERGLCGQCGLLMDRNSDSESDSDDDSLSGLSNEEISDDFEDEDLDASAVYGEFDEDFDGQAREGEPHLDFGSDLGSEEEALAQRELWRLLVRSGRLPRNLPFEQFARDGRRHRIVDSEAEDEDMGHDLNEEDEDDDESGSIHDFLDDRDVGEITAMTISSPTIEERTPARPRNRHRHEQQDHSDSESSSDSDSDSDSDGVRHNPQFHRPQVPVYTIHDDDDDDEEEEIRPIRRRAVHHIASDSDDSDDEPRRISTHFRQQPASRRSQPPVLARRPRPLVIDSDDSDSESSTTADGNSRPPIEISDDEDTEAAFFQAQRNRTHNSRPAAASVGSSDRSSVDDEIEPDDYSIDGHDLNEGFEGFEGASTSNGGFSPIQSGSEDGAPQTGMDYFNVYGDEEGSGDEDEVDEDEDEDEY